MHTDYVRGGGDIDACVSMSGGKQPLESSSSCWRQMLLRCCHTLKIGRSEMRFCLIRQTTIKHNFLLASYCPSTSEVQCRNAGVLSECTCSIWSHSAFICNAVWVWDIHRPVIVICHRCLSIEAAAVGGQEAIRRSRAFAKLSDQLIVQGCTQSNSE